MLGKHFEAYLMENNTTPYKTMEEAEKRLQTTQRNFPEMKGNILNNGTITYYYEPMELSLGKFVVCVSYTKKNE